MTIGTVYSASKKDLQSLAQWTQEQLTTLASSIAAGWNAEHDGDGHHTSITASSITTRALSFRSLLFPANLAAGFGSIVAPGAQRVELPSSGTYNDLAILPGLSLVYISVIGGATLTGLESTYYAPGSAVILVSDCVTDNVVLSQEDSGSRTENRFAGNGSTPGTTITITPGRFVVLLRSYRYGLSQPRWLISFS
jgi:hypothetical protein